MNRVVFSIIRWLMALAFVYGGFRVGVVAITKYHGFGATIPILCGMGMALLGVLFAAPELVHWATAPLRRVFAGIYDPKTPLDRSPPNYTLPRFYRKHRRYAEALHWYHQLLRDHPGEAAAYREAIATAFEAGEPVLARKLRQTALRKLRDEAERAEVERIFETARALPPSGFTVEMSDPLR